MNDVITDSDNPLLWDATPHALLIEDYEHAKADLSRAEAEVQQLREQILKILPADTPDGVILLVNDDARLSWRPSYSRILDQRRLRRTYPAIASECTNVVPRWTLRSLSTPLPAAPRGES